MGNCLITRHGGTSGGGASGYYWKVDYYNSDGSILLYTNYIVNGQNAPTYSFEWNTSPNQTEETVGILNNVNQNLTVYKILNGALIPLMTSDTTPSGTASASSVVATGYEAFKAFDRSNTTCWIPRANVSDNFIMYSWGASHTLNSITISTMSSNAGLTLTFQILGQKSDDSFENCILEGSTTELVFPANSSLSTKTIELNGGQYKAIKLFTSSQMHFATYGCSIVEVQVIGQ